MVKTIVFSKDRALQLRSTLDSFFLHCEDADKTIIFVVYTSSSETYQKQYNKLEELFGVRRNLFFVKEQSFRTTVLQLLNPFENKSFLFKAYQFFVSVDLRIVERLNVARWLINKSQSLLQGNYILFLVDDNIFVHDFSISEAVQKLTQCPKALGFSLRLGRNTNFSYMTNTHQNLPEFEQVSPNGNILKFQWKNAEYDFGYPLEVSSSLYRIRDVLPLIIGLRFNNPNFLEGYMAQNVGDFQKLFPELLCFQESVTFCNPINLVQNVSVNRAGSSVSMSIQTLARLFDEGCFVDVEKYNGFIPNSCHQEVELILKKTEPINMTNSLISVIMPVYNSEKYLREAVESILNQTYKNFELVIVDDNSTDNSALIIENYKRIDSRIIAYRQPKNSGIAAARNKGLQLSTGEYIAFMDSDDISMPYRLEKQYQFIESHPEVGVLGGGAEIIDGNGNHTSTIFFPETDLMITWSLCFYDPIINPTVMIRRSTVLDTGGYRDLRESDNEYYPEDYDLWARLLGKTNFYNLKEVVLKLRKHSSNITETRIESTIKNSLIISQKYIASIIGVEPKIEVVGALWNMDQNGLLRDAANILVKLYECFQKKNVVSALEDEFLKKDLSIRLLTMAKTCPDDPSFMKVVIQALKYHPFTLILFPILGVKIKRIIRRMLKR